MHSRTHMRLVTGSGPFSFATRPRVVKNEMTGSLP
jgi:hypothetical protein